MSKTSSQIYSVRLSDGDLAIIDQISTVRGISRAEAVRMAIKAAGPLVVGSTSINIPRVLMTLEILVAECMDRVERRDPESVERFVSIATKRVGEYHA